MGFLLQSGVTWETALRLVQSELKAFQREGIDPLSESVARELFFLAASKVKQAREQGGREGWMERGECFWMCVDDDVYLRLIVVYFIIYMYVWVAASMCA